MKPALKIVPHNIHVTNIFKNFTPINGLLLITNVLQMQIYDKFRGYTCQKALFITKIVIIL